MSLRRATYKAPSFLSRSRTRHIYRRRLRSASSGDLVVPATRRLTMGNRAFAVAGPRAWKKLPDSVRQSSSLDVFNRLLKTHLFSLSFN